MCNIAIRVALRSAKKGLQMKNPKTGMVHLVKSAEDVIEFNEASMTPLTEQNKSNPETAEQRAKREEENAKVVKRCKAAVERRKYHDLTGNIAGFENAGDLERRHMKQEAQFTLTFGLGFVTMMFLGFVSGYLFARRILGWEELPSLFCCLFVGITTIIVEMILMIFRIQKLEKI